MNRKYASQIDYGRMPGHVAIIMDGNGRWAAKRFLPRSAGHKAGAEGLRRLVEEADRIELKYLTVYAFSSENWSRPAAEITQLMDMMRQYIQQYIDDSEKNNIRLKIIGESNRLDADLREKLLYVQELTRDKTGLTLVIALNYGARDEIVRACRAMRDHHYANNGYLSSGDITEESLSRFMDTSGIPDPDLLIRTSGEHRLSNFLLWQLAYTELVFVQKYWPDFNIDDLCEAIIEFQKRDRRFGR